MSLNKEIVQLVSHAEVAFESCLPGQRSLWCLVLSYLAVLLFTSVEIQCLLAEYGIDGLRTVPVTSSREDRHVTCLALMDRAATSQAMSQELESFVKQQVSARTVPRGLQLHGPSARRPWLRLPLTLHHMQYVFNGVINEDPGRTNGETSFFQRNSGSVYSFQIVAFVFGGLVVNAHWQREFVIVILAHHLA
ncbi:HTH_Tnp_Tc3_2 domain-containing protein [Trichonephila clavipes]|nr:HTH_Tnp_Tc3_2 domain-containing protein [Trichonephila clavipes]